MKKASLSALIFSTLFIFSSFSFAADFEEFKTLARDTVDKVASGNLSNSEVEKLIKVQRKLMSIGKSACREYADSNPADAKMLNLVSDNANKMAKLSLSEIEAQWHEKGFLRSKGVDVDKLEEESVTGSLMDTVVHPATAIIALKQYKATKNARLLQQVSDELEEVLHHVERIEM